MPNITTQPLNVTKVTSDSITISWERWAGCTANPDPIIYKVGITANDNPWPGNYWKTVKEGKGFYTYTFTGLKPETEYVFNVKAFDESGQVCQYPLVNGSMSAKTPAPDKEPPTVSSLKFKNVKITYNSIHVEWEPAKDNLTPANKIKYQVYFMPNQPNEPHHMVSEGTNLTSYTFKNLQPDTEYLVHVFAWDEAGNFIRYPAQNASQRIKTLIEDHEPPTVLSTEFTSIYTTPSSIKVTWEKAKDNITPENKIKYQVYFMQDLPNEPHHKVAEGTNLTSYTFTGLKDKTDYLVHVFAEDECGNFIRYPAKNASQRIRTGVWDKTPPTVSNASFQKIEVTSNSITVTWEKAKDNLQAADKILYKMYIKEDVDKQESRQVAEGYNLSTYTFKGLKADTDYLVYVRAYDGADNFVQYPGSCAAKRIRTAKPDTEKPTVTSSAFKNIRTTANSIYVEWEAAKDNVTPANKIRYKLYFKEEASTESIRLIKDDTGYYSYTFTGLKAETNYLVRVVGYDEAGNNVQYPAQNAAFRIKTGNPDKVKPTASDTAFKDIHITPTTIHVEWEPATDNVTKSSDIVYKIYIKQSDGSTSNMNLVKQGKMLFAHTFTGLKKSTEYYVQVCAVDESGNVLQYPAQNAVYRITTAAVEDTKAPTVTSRAFKVTNVLDDQFTIQWEKASDNVTPANKIRYKVNLTEYSNPKDPWRTVKEAKGISSHTFTGLKANTKYSFCVKAYDEAGNLLQYPADNSSTYVLTKPKKVHQISFSIEQGASVLMGTNTISFAIEYTYIQLNSSGSIIGRGSGSWEYKWSNKKGTSGVITLPANCYFEDNQVFVRIRSRRAASAGLNTWKACSSGYVDVSSGNLKFKLTGSYYSYSVRLGGSAADGYAQFK